MFKFTDLSDACVKCGKCRPNCTIFKISGDEVRSPRGFLELIGAYSRGELELDKSAKKTFESCFLCTNCVDMCPTSIATDEMIENVRYEIAKKFGIAWYKRVFFWLLRHRKIMDFSAKMGYVFQSCAFKLEKNEGENANMKPRFSLPMVKKERLLPSAAKSSFLNSHAEFIDNGGTRTIGIFIGCMANYAYTDIGEGLLKILKELKINAHLMKNQACCAAPAYFTGDFATTMWSAKRNIAYFEEILKTCEAIICAEGTCSAMLKIDYEKFLRDRGEKAWADRAKIVMSKLFLATEYFAKFTNLEQILESKMSKKTKQTLVYHDPCHARKMQGVWREPRQLLSKIFDLKNSGDETSCCGFGGVTMQSEHYHLAKKAGIARANTLNSAGAKFLGAECSACKMQLNNSLNLINASLRCKNPIELIAAAL